MTEGFKARFRSPRAALRFYFRASELLSDSRAPGFYSRTNRDRRDENRGAIGDFLSVDTCFAGLGEIETWLLRELYGPDCFGEPARPVSRICENARRKFPRLQWTPGLVNRLKQRTLERVSEKLRRERLIS